MNYTYDSEYLCLEKRDESVEKSLVFDQSDERRNGMEKRLVSTPITRTLIRINLEFILMVLCAVHFNHYFYRFSCNIYLLGVIDYTQE